MGTLDGQVAIVTGAARGQGRSHALALAREGASVVICDIGAADIATLPYPVGSEAELAETAALIAEAGADSITVVADLREPDDVARLVQATLDRYDRIDIAVLNHGIATYGPLAEMSDQVWRETMDSNLHSFFACSKAIVPHMIERQYGRIVMTSSGLARGGSASVCHYVATKWGVIGLAKSLAAEVARSGITVNCVLPAITRTPMILHDTIYKLFRPDLSEPTVEDFKQAVIDYVHPVGVPWVEPEDITGAVAYLVSDEARYVTGSTVHVSAGHGVITSA